MHYIKALNLSLILSFLLLLLSGCTNQITQPQGPLNITGKLLDKNGIEVHQAAVSMNYRLPVTVNRDGSFIIADATTPYDLIITLKRDSICYVFKSLTTATPVIRLHRYEELTNINQAILNVRFPEILRGKRGVLKFISQDNCKTLDPFVYEGETSRQLPVRWSSSNDCIHGTLIILEYTLSNSIILTFDNYGQKDITLHNEDNLNMVFTPLDIQYNPPDTTMSSSLPFPYYSNMAVLSIAFNGYNENSNLEIGNYTQSLPVYYVVPSTLPLPYKIKFDFVHPLSYYGCSLEKWTVVPPGSSVSFAQDPCIIQLNPSNDTTGVDYNTTFNYTGGNDEGIYAVNFEGNYDIVVVTKSERTSLPLLVYCGFPFPWNAHYTWFVQYLSVLRSMDEFVKPDAFSNSSRLNTIIGTSIRNFHMKRDSTVH